MVVQAEAAALEYVNWVLADLDQPAIEGLPVGTPGSVVACSVARGFWHVAEPGQVRVSTHLIITFPNGVRRVWGVPHNVQAFMRSYDARHYPDLIASLVEGETIAAAA